jgi:peptide/nickel transport system substrate-binding protein
MRPSLTGLPVLTAMAIVMLVGCGPATTSPVGGGQAPDTGVRATRALTFALRVEPIFLTTKALRTAAATISTTTRLFNAGLAYIDDQAQYHPYLAEALPQLNTETWRVFPDGRMETIYRLKPGLTWHDGAPLTADDYAFALRVYQTPEFAQASLPPQSLIESIDASDPRTLLIRWRQSFADADILDVTLPGDSGESPRRLNALPRHLLQDALDKGDPDGFVAHPYWSTQFVGMGPWRLTRWEPGAFIEGEAFAGHALGRPKIDRIRIIFTPDPNAALANLLSGGADIAADDTMRYQQTAILEREWAGNNGGTVLKSYDQHRRAEIQMHPDRANPITLLDVSLRRALAQAIDRQELIDALVEGQGKIANTLIAPGQDYFAEADGLVTRYPYDLRQADQLLNQAGYARGSDSVYVHPSAGRLRLEVKTLEGGQNEAEMTIIADQLRRAGLDVSEGVVPAAQIQDGQVRASFSGVQTTSGGPIDILSSKNTPRPENRWQGHNRGSWANPEFDRLIGLFETTLDRPERAHYIAQAAKLYSDEVPSIPLYYNVRVVPYVSALKGPIAMAPPLWNVHLWELTG